MNGYTKLYKEEIDLIYKTNSIAALKVYTHLKDKYRYYKQDIYDYMSCMSQNLEMPERTIKDVIKRLKNVGLIECRREWIKSDGVPKSSNYYSFPIVDMIEKSEHKEKETPKEENNNTELQPNTEFDTEAKISPNEPYLATNDTDVPQEGESLPEVKIEAKEEEIIINTDNTEEMGTLIGTLSNFATVETRRIEHEEDRSMEHMMKCLSTFDINKAKHQISKAKSVDENMKRVADCLDPILVEFSKTERSKFYISIIEDALNSN